MPFLPPNQQLQSTEEVYQYNFQADTFAILLAVFEIVWSEVQTCIRPS